MVPTSNRRNKLSIVKFITKLTLHNSKNLYLSPAYWDGLHHDLKEKITALMDAMMYIWVISIYWNDLS
jgi:hypothetical protein